MTDQLPASLLVRQVTGDPRLLFGSGYALLLQVAHPTVGAGVSEHSQFQAAPWRRLLSTLDFLFVMTCGSPHQAASMGAQVRRMHTRIKGVHADGTRYHALEPGAFAWVHATLAHATIRAHRATIGPIARRTLEEYYDGWLELGGLLGVRDRDLPATVTGFEEYVQTMISEVLVRTGSVDDVLRTLRRPPFPLQRQLPVPDLAWRAARRLPVHSMMLSSTGLAEPVLRDRLHLDWTAAQQLQWELLRGALRVGGPVWSRMSTGGTYMNRIRPLNPFALPLPA